MTAPDTDTTTDTAPGGRTWTEQGTTWVVWHAGELLGLLVPLILAAAFTAWLALISVTVAIGWAVHEVLMWRNRRAVAAGQPVALITGKPTTTTTTGTTNTGTSMGSEASA
jgi:hypothetical protein